MSTDLAIPTWIIEFQAFSGVVVAASAVAVAAAGWRVSNRQATIARQKLRLDLYPLRLRVYDAAHAAIVSAINFGPTDTLFDQATVQFRDSLREARFLFDSEVFDYLNALLSSILQFRHAESLAIKDPDYHGRDHLHEFRKQHETNTKFVFESLQGLHKKLGAYLRVDEGLSTSTKLVAPMSSVAGIGQQH